ncbi:hypothetical protein AVEN_153915-1 [Araneus ventricosus]|uniref:Uncharacterized protein n=1 Tax=Araneus ventricosus TaxID=182803 RepID=A0A4Y2F914_ARAVE|nr:hypothetical protein AVEN_153915-1 [Araneus ventricosus]
MNKSSPLTSFCTCLRSIPPKQDGLVASALASSPEVPGSNPSVGMDVRSGSESTLNSRQWQICTSHTVKQTGMDSKHNDCTSSSFQRVVFQVILPSPVLIDDCEEPIRLLYQTAMQDVREMYEHQKWKSESWRELQQLLPQADFVQWMLGMRSDEATFSREGIFNLLNQHVWSDSNPHCTTPRQH